MKRSGNLYPQIIDFANLIEAIKKAQRGKRFRDNVLDFNYNLEVELANIKSQLESKTLFANIYLNGFDHFIKEELKGKKYLRYVDDFALFSDDREFLAEAQQAIADYLVNLRLKLHPVKSQLIETQHGANFLGFRILPDRIRVRNENLRRGRRRLRQMQKDYSQGRIAYKDVSASIQSWVAHLKHGE